MPYRQHALSPLFEPQSVLVIEDGQQNLAHWSGALQRLNWPSDQARLKDWAQRPDLVVISVARAHTAPVLGALVTVQPRAVMVLSQDPAPELTQLCADWSREQATPLLGPHSFGLQRPFLELNLSLHERLARPGRTALVCQSRALTGAILDWADDNQTAFSLIVSLGTEADIGLPQVLDYLASDPRTDSIALYLEDVGEARRFMSSLRTAAGVKPVVVLKAGHRDELRSSVRPLGDASRPERSAQDLPHNPVIDAALRRAGAVRVRFFVQLFSALKILGFPNRPKGRRLAILSNGGGPAQLALDWMPNAGLHAAELSVESQQQLQEVLSHQSWFDNPVVEFQPMSPGALSDAGRILLGDPGVDGLMVVLAPDRNTNLGELTEALADLGRRSRKPLITCLLGDASMRPLRQTLERQGVAAFRTPETAVDAFGLLASYDDNQKLLLQVPRPHAREQEPDLVAARLLIQTALADGYSTLDEPASKALLAAFGVPVVPTLRVRTLPEAIMAGQQLGFPLALKVCSVDIPRKSQVGGVLLDIRSTEELMQAWARLESNLHEAAPAARIEGFSLQRMAGRSQAVELDVGLQNDPVFGPVIRFGVGGTRPELNPDRSLELAPLNAFLAERLIARTRVGAQVLQRELSADHLNQLIDLLIAVSDLACDLPQIQRVDINPIMAGPDGLVAADARIVLHPASEKPLRVADAEDAYSHMAIHPYPAELEQSLLFADGTPWQIRPVRPEDAQALQTFTRGLSEHTRYMRFISTMRELSPRMLARYTNIDYHRELALLATAPRVDAQGDWSEEILGVARYLRNPDGDSAEYALVIGDAWQGRGLGRHLMQAIIDAARAKGLKRLEGFVLKNNGPMVKLMTRLGLQNDPDPDDDTMRRIWMNL